MKDIKVLGTGCAKCNKLSETVKDYADSNGIEYSFEKVTDIIDIATYGATMTPALVLDGKVVLSGRIPTADMLDKLFK